MDNFKSVIMAVVLSILLVGCSDPKPDEEKVAVYTNELQAKKRYKLIELTMSCLGKELPGKDLNQKIRNFKQSLIEDQENVEKDLKKSIEKSFKKNQDCLNLSEAYYRECLGVMSAHKEHKKHMELMGTSERTEGGDLEKINCEDKAHVLLINAILFTR